MQTKEWDEHYKNAKYLQWWPNESLVGEFSRILKSNSTQGNLGNVLDFGCGNGRNCRFLIEQCQRYDISLSLFGVDISSESIKLANNFVSNFSPNQKFDLRTYDGQNIPWSSNFFDIVYSVAVLDQLKFNDAKFLCNEIYRVMKSSGKFLIDLEFLPNDSFQLDENSLVEENTFLINSDCENGIFQHYYTNNEIDNLFEHWSSWKIIEKYTSSMYDEQKLIRYNERALIVAEK